MKFSIIIPTYNRDEDLEECLKSLKEKSLYENEIIVLYNLNEKTKAVCDKYGVKSVFDNARKNGKRVKSLWGILNEGVNAASNDYVLYLNDDCLVLPEWDKIVGNYFENNEKLGLLVLKTYGIGQIPYFRIGMLDGKFEGIPCANYAIINKKAGHVFDEKIQWYYGDADIALQFANDDNYDINYTEEDIIIHNHKEDTNRTIHDTDFFNNLRDERYFSFKWVNYKSYEKFHIRHYFGFERIKLIFIYSYKYIYTVLRVIYRKVKRAFLKKEKNR